MLPEEIRVIELSTVGSEEYDPYVKFYQIKIAYEGTYIYVSVEKHKKKKEPTAQEIVDAIILQVIQFNKIISSGAEENCIDLITESIGARYYENGFINEQGVHMEYLDWSEELEFYVYTAFENKEKNNQTLKEIYDICVRNFKEAVSDLSVECKF